MRFDRIIKSVIAIADKITSNSGRGDAQVPVQHYQWTGSDDYSAAIYDAPVERLAIVEMKQRFQGFGDTDEVVSKPHLTFLRPLKPHGALGRREPVDPRDKFVLPNGYSGPVKDVLGLETNLANSPYMVEVILG